MHYGPLQCGADLSVLLRTAKCLLALSVFTFITLAMRIRQVGKSTAKSAFLHNVPETVRLSTSNRRTSPNKRVLLVNGRSHTDSTTELPQQGTQPKLTPPPILPPLKTTKQQQRQKKTSLHTPAHKLLLI